MRTKADPKAVAENLKPVVIEALENAKEVKPGKGKRTPRAPARPTGWSSSPASSASASAMSAYGRCWRRRRRVRSAGWRPTGHWEPTRPPSGSHRTRRPRPRGKQPEGWPGG